MEEQEKSNTEQLIVEAAEVEFFAKGLDGARTTAIAERAGVTHAMLNYYFRKKELLFEHVVSRNVSLVVQTMSAAIGDPNMPIVDRLRNAVDSHFDLIVLHPQLPRFFMNEVLMRPKYSHLFQEKLSGVGASLFQNFQRAVDEAAERGEIERVDVRMLLISVLSLNIFSVMALPFIQSLGVEPVVDMVKDREQYLEKRKAENVETIMRRIEKR